MKVCSVPGCPEIIPNGQGRCADHEQQADRARGTAAERGYGRAHRAFRRAVLRRDPMCVIDGCTKPAEHADHYPLSLRELRARGLDPYTADRGRGLCQPHHASETARLQPGGFNAR